LQQKNNQVGKEEEENQKYGKGRKEETYKKDSWI
jgi:hypothetical protein